MGGTDRLPLVEAERLANEVVELLRPVTDKILVAGSVRRRKPDCGDIEVLVIPRYSQVEQVVAEDLFGTTTAMVNVSLVDQLCGQLRTDGVFRDRLDVNGRPAWGSSYKRTSYKGFALDLFCASVETWACVQAIRTGPAAFTRRMVTLRSLDPTGFCPSHLQFKDGHLVYRKTGEPLPGIETEDDVFRALGVITLPPELRTDTIMPHHLTVRL